jgi:hypothetical protein
MSFDIPQMHIPDDSPEVRAIEAIISREHLSLEEVVRRALRGMDAKRPRARPAAARGRATKHVAPLTDDEINQLKVMNPVFGLLEDVPEEKIDRMAQTIQRMKRESFQTRA